MELTSPEPVLPTSDKTTAYEFTPVALNVKPIEPDSSNSLPAMIQPASGKGDTTSNSNGMELWEKLPGASTAPLSPQHPRLGPDAPAADARKGGSREQGS